MSINYRFKKLGKKHLVTDEMGGFRFVEASARSPKILSKEDLRSAIGLDRKTLTAGHQVDSLALSYGRKHCVVFGGTSLHIVVVTLRCDHACSYCQASSCSPDGKGMDMDRETAEKTVDLIMASSAKNLTIEFQGGEPLLNFDIIQYVIKIAKKKAKENNKTVIFTIVSNLMFMNEEILKYIVKEKIGVCTSLDGPKALHNSQRLHRQKGVDSHAAVAKWIRRISQEQDEDRYPRRVNALPTITRKSLPYAKQIIDEFVSLGLNRIFLRSVHPFGVRHNLIDKELAVPAKAFMRFYREAMEYILDLNRRGVVLVELGAIIFLEKILLGEDPRFMDLRSPCGASIGQLAYNYNGDIYSCDEGRMFSAGAADESFRLGNVRTSTQKDLIDNPVTKALCLASCLDALPRCTDCVYKPYCGVCPIYNYSQGGHLHDATGGNDRCERNEAILDYLFEKIDSPDRAILESWVRK